jgi:hypothetical protein
MGMMVKYLALDPSKQWLDLGFMVDGAMGKGFVRANDERGLQFL